MALVSGSMRATVSFPALRNQTAPSPTAMLLGAAAVSTNAASCSESGPIAAMPLPAGAWAAAPFSRGRGHREQRGGERAGDEDEPGGQQRAVTRAARAGRRTSRAASISAAQRRVALAGLLREPPVQHRIQRRIALERRRLLAQVRPHRLGRRLAAERRRAGEALVEHAGERVAVGAPVDRLAADLLRGEVVERAGRRRPRRRSAACVTPKSVRYACSSSSRSTFAGLTSRWTRPCRCAASSAPAIWPRIASARSGASAPSRCSSRLRSLPWT